MRIIFLLLLTSTLTTAQTMAVYGIEGRGMAPSDVRTATITLQGELAKYGYRVIERDELNKLFTEQALQLTGGVDQVVQVGRIAGVDKIVTGTVGFDGDDIFYYALKLIDVETGEIINTKYTEVKGSYPELLDAAGYATGCLLGIQKDKIRTGTVNVPVRNVIIQETEQKITHDVHVYQHSGTKAGFVPCNFCQGLGSTQQSGKKIDCPYCSITSLYSGQETRYRPMTGRWVK
jgi:curli biogenesis system outer membrane secretion channel CsgG/DNA-directed RNA polymerase subunit RPC12/RpoP